MAKVDPSNWTCVGESSNSRYYELEAEVLGCVPRDGAIDDLASARANIAFQNAYWRERGHGGVVVVFIDYLSSQDKDARRVYQSEPDPAFMRGTALVGGSMLARAIGSFFLGMVRPRIPVKMVATLAEALAWAQQLNRQAQTHHDGGRPG